MRIDNDNAPLYFNQTVRIVEVVSHTMKTTGAALPCEMLEGSQLVAQSLTAFDLQFWATGSHHRIALGREDKERAAVKVSPRPALLAPDDPVAEV